MRSLTVFSGLLCGAGLIATARAQTAPGAALANPSSAELAERGYTIALVASAERPALTARLHAELADLGFHVKEAPADLPRDALDTLADGKHVLALVRVDETSRAIEFRIHAPESDELIRERVPLRPRRPDVAAVATVELLRARLITLGILKGSPPPPLPQPTRPPPLPPPPPSAPGITADVSAGAWYSAGGLGASPALALGLRGHPKRWLAVGALGAFEPQSRQFTSTEGSVRARALLLGALTDFGFSAGRARFELGGGVALGVLRLAGEAATPFAGRVTRSYGIAPVARTSVGFRLVGPVSLHTALVGGVSNPRVAVRFADRTVARWGRPFLLGLLGLEVGF